MLKLIVVAGNRTDGFVNLLKDTGSVEVTHSYESLYKHSEELNTSIYRADKLLYVYSDADMNVRGDMQLLQDLLEGRYFNVDEIVFFIATPDVPEAGISYIDFVVDVVGEKLKNEPTSRLPDITVKRFDESLRYDSIYEALLGRSQDVVNDGKMKMLYRVDRSSDAKRAYEPEDDEDHVIEPHSYRRVRKYEEVQRIELQSENGEILTESVELSGLTKITDDLGSIRYFDPTQKKQIAVVSGIPKSGVTTLATMLSLSAVSSGVKVMILDLKKDKALSYVLETANVAYEDINLVDFLRVDAYKQEQSVSLFNSFKYENRLHAYTSLLANLSRFDFGMLVVDVAQEDVEELVKLNRDLSISYLFTSTTNAVDITEVSKLFSSVTEAGLLLTKSINQQSQYTPVAVEDIKEGIKNLTFIAEATAVHFDLKPYLYQNLIEVRI